MATDIIARGMAANVKKSVTALGNKIESEKWIGTKAEWEAVDKSTIKDGTIVYITDDETVILYDKAEMEKIAAQVATDRKAAETAAQTAQAVADSLPDDYVTAVAKIAENTADISNIKLTDKELQRRVNALYDMGNGVTHKFETDSETAYAKTIPTGGKLMSVKSVGGRSIVWNQLVSQLIETTSASVTGVKLTDKTLQISGTSTNVVFLRIVPVQTAIIGHKYLFHSHASNTTGLSSFNGFYNNESETDKRFYEYGKGIIFTNADNAIEMRLRLDDDVTVNFQITPQLFDLTAMFGVGNEPSTVEEFEKMFPNDYYQYNSGEIITADTESVVVQGRNLWDEIWEEGSIDSETGADSTAPTVIRSKNYTPIIPKSTYIFAYAGSTAFENVKTRFYDINKKYIGYNDNNGQIVYPNRAFITPLNAFYVRFTLPPQYGNVYKNDIALITGSSGTYAPYHSNVYHILEAIRNLPGYGWSAGTVRSYVDYENKKYYQCVQIVDLGTVNWVAGNSGKVSFQTSQVKGQKLTKNYNVPPNILCSKYSTKTQNDMWGKTSVTGITTNASVDGYIYVNDTFYTDAAAFQQAMQGVVLYYELESPIVTDISTLIDDDFLRNIEVEAGGSVTFKNGNDNYHIPVPSEEEYIVKLSEVGGTT